MTAIAQDVINASQQPDDCTRSGLAVTAITLEMWGAGGQMTIAVMPLWRNSTRQIDGENIAGCEFGIDLSGLVLAGVRFLMGHCPSPSGQ